ncbi:MAG TPA: ASPIC/UnbV domain-containing protein, partial [Acidimicrobiia bacterium]|nr:ASPIC/UnbV domain-containing protein [Acidimicrobiia bacterium]
PDIVVVERRVPVRLWQNTGESLGNWLLIDLDQPGVNRDAVGAWLEVEAGPVSINREITVGGGHASGEIGWIHLGLGSADEARVRVVWPDGDTSDWETIPTNRRVLWAREDGPREWSAG